MGGKYSLRIFLLASYPGNITITQHIAIALSDNYSRLNMLKQLEMEKAVIYFVYRFFK